MKYVTFYKIYSNKRKSFVNAYLQKKAPAGEQTSETAEVPPVVEPRTDGAEKADKVDRTSPGENDEGNDHFLSQMERLNKLFEARKPENQKTATAMSEEEHKAAMRVVYGE
jgi:hypothetical protein